MSIEVVHLSGRPLVRIDNEAIGELGARWNGSELTTGRVDEDVDHVCLGLNSPKCTQSFRRAKLEWEKTILTLPRVVVMVTYWKKRVVGEKDEDTV